MSLLPSLAPLSPLYIMSVSSVLYSNSSQSDSTLFEASKCFGKRTVLGILKVFYKAKTAGFLRKRPTITAKKGSKTA